MPPDDEDDNSIIGGLKKLAVLEGYETGTEAFERRVRQLQVTKCREMKGVSSCHECKFFDYCDLVKRVMRERRGLRE
jgi:hypothetical protein